jgi:hypothetical protein
MLRYFKLLITAAIAIGVMGAMVSSASAQTLTVRASTTTASASSVTLSDPTVGTVIGSLSLTISVPAGTYTANTGTTLTLTQVGTVTGCAAVVLSPAGATVNCALNLNWTVNAQSFNSAFLADLGTSASPASNILLRVLGVEFTTRSGILSDTCSGNPLSAGFYDTILRSGGGSDVLTGTTSGVFANAGTGRQCTLSGTLTNAPAISYTIS